MQGLTEEEAKREKRLIFLDFIVDMIKYPLLTFVVVYVVAWTITVWLLSEQGLQLCAQLIK